MKFPALSLNQSKSMKSPGSSIVVVVVHSFVLVLTHLCPNVHFAKEKARRRQGQAKEQLKSKRRYEINISYHHGRKRTYYLQVFDLQWPKQVLRLFYRSMKLATGIINIGVYVRPIERRRGRNHPGLDLLH